MHSRKEQMEAFGRFLDILDELRVNARGIVNRLMKAYVLIRLRRLMNSVTL